MMKASSLRMLITRINSRGVFGKASEIEPWERYTPVVSPVSVPTPPCFNETFTDYLKIIITEEELRKRSIRCDCGFHVNSCPVNDRPVFCKLNTNL